MDEGGKDSSTNRGSKREGCPRRRTGRCPPFRRGQSKGPRTRVQRVAIAAKQASVCFQGKHLGQHGQALNEHSGEIPLSQGGGGPDLTKKRGDLKMLLGIGPVLNLEKAHAESGVFIFNTRRRERGTFGCLEETSREVGGAKK